MSAVQAKVDIPDSWFEFFARLMPGLAFVAAVLALHQGMTSSPTGAGVVIIIAAGYFIGLFTSPVGSLISRSIERWQVVKKTGNVHFIRRAQLDLGRSGIDAMTLSKMHGEVTFFTQCCVLSVVYLIGEFLVPPQGQAVGFYALIVAVIAMILAVMVASRQVDKAVSFVDAAESSTSSNPG